jgi:hypothetical protein
VVIRKGSGEELVAFLTAASEQVIDALADRYCVADVGQPLRLSDVGQPLRLSDVGQPLRLSEPPGQAESLSYVIEQCGFRRAHLVSRGTEALDF